MLLNSLKGCIKCSLRIVWYQNSENKWSRQIESVLCSISAFSFDLVVFGVMTLPNLPQSLLSVQVLICCIEHSYHVDNCIIMLFFVQHKFKFLNVDVNGFEVSLQNSRPAYGSIYRYHEDKYFRFFDENNTKCL